MNKAPVVVKIAGRARRANVEGETVWREEEIYIPSYRAVFRTLETYDHFVYYQGKRFGSTTMCTCGATAGIYNPDVYLVRFQSVNKGQVVACNSLMQDGVHADGSRG